MFEIKISIEATALAEAITRLADALAAKPEKQAAQYTSTTEQDSAHVLITSTRAEVEGAEAVLPAGSEYTVTAVDPAQVQVTDAEKPKKTTRKKRAQEPQEAPEPPAPEQTPPEPQNAQESAQEAPVNAPEPAEPEKPVPTIDQIANAGAALLDTDIEGMMPKLLALLQEFGVQAITQLKPEQLGEFAERLRALGAEV